MKRHIKLFEEFIPKETDSKDSWDIPTSKNCSIKTITIYDENGKTLVYNQEKSKGLIVGDAYFTNNDNDGYTFNLHRQWIDSSLGDQIMNYMEKNFSEYQFPLDAIEKIEVVLLPEGAKKTFILSYEFDGVSYKLSNRRYLPLD
jgi:hypothetical protein